MTAEPSDFDRAFYADQDPTPIRPPLPPRAPATEADAYGSAALNDELDTLATTPTGHRNDALNRAGFNLGQLVAQGRLPHDATWNALYTVAVGIGLEDGETRKTLASSFDGAANRPRAVPVADLDNPAPLPVLRAVAAADELARETEAAEAGEPMPSARERYAALDWVKLWADDTEEEWIAQPLIPARRLIALFSPPKLGKSLLLLELAVQVAMGTEAFARPLDRPRRVLYVDFENDPKGDIRARLMAMGRSPADLANLFYLSFPTLPKLDTVMGGLELMAAVADYDVELVVIDTISRAVAGEENDNDTWLAFYKHTGLRLKAAGVACIRLDHTGKDTSKGMRGGSAKSGDVDAVWSLTKISEDVLHLECVANRLPITEKSLTLRREVNPVLRHAVDTGGIASAKQAAIATCVKALNELGVDKNLAYRPTRALLKLERPGLQAGWSDKIVDAAQRARREGLATFQPTLPEIGE